MESVKQLLGEVRRMDEKWRMIDENGSVAVGLSGGKDSLMLLYLLSEYRRLRAFDLTAITVKPEEGFQTLHLGALCEQMNVHFVSVEGNLLSTVMQERNPCALCARLRRGMLIRACMERHIPVLALGHHREDLAETMLMNLLEGGRAAALQPVLEPGRENVKVVRPLLRVPEAKLRRAAEGLGLPIQKNPCPAEGKTGRTKAESALQRLTELYPDAAEKMLHAAENDLFPQGSGSEK